jgi:hypothetical protein
LAERDDQVLVSWCEAHNAAALCREHGLCCSDNALMVCEEEHLRPFTEFGQHLECRGGTLVVEVDKQVVEDDWERLRKLPELVLEPSETQCKVELVTDAVT